jgi:DNA-binding winged helix-turn-helix (wHTH) protein/TolB-like protein
MNDPRNLSYEFGPYCVDVIKRQLLKEGQPVQIASKAFDILLILIEQSGTTISKQDLMQRAWPQSYVEEGNLAVNISALRKALGDSGNLRKYIVTVPGEGYRFIAAVKGRWYNSPELELEEHTKTRITIQKEETTGGQSYVQRVEDGPTFLPTALNRRNLSLYLTRRSVLSSFIVITLLALAYFLALKRSNPYPHDFSQASVAVLPFKPVISDARDEALELGMADGLITELSKPRRFTLRPTSSVQRFNDPARNAIRAGQEMGAEVVVDGSVQRVGDKVLINVQLINVEDGLLIWADQFESDIKNLPGMQNKISRQVLHALNVRLSSGEEQLLSRKETENAEAYEAYIKGRFYWNKRTEEGLKKAIEYFDRAIDKDANYALAYSGLSDCYVLLGIYVVLPPAQAMPKAEAAAKKALTIDSSLAEAHTSLAYIRFRYQWVWEESEKEFKQAIELNPNYSLAHHWYGDFLVAMGRFDEAIAEMKKAQQLDPLSLMITTDLGGALTFSGRCDEAIGLHQRTIEMDPHFVQAHRYLGQAYECKGMYGEAIEEFLESLSSSPDDPDGLTMLAHAYALAGNKERAEKVLSRLNEISKHHYIAPYDIAPIYAALGQKDQAFAWLQRACEERCEGLTLLKVDPAFNSLRPDPRFTDLMHRVGL